jgi:hypothetical protein
MGLIARLFGAPQTVRAVGETVAEVAGVFTENQEARAERVEARLTAAQTQFAQEFSGEQTGFEAFVNALNRLPRPAMAIGTIGLFVYAMVDPHGFAIRMDGLGAVPEPLWWLLGAIVSFYFGARELHHRRAGRPVQRAMAADRNPVIEALANPD